jgi:hypothetical protein
VRVRVGVEALEKARLDDNRIFLLELATCFLIEHTLINVSIIVHLIRSI